MSITLDSTTDRCKYDAVGAPPTGDYTMMVWFLSTNFAARYQTPAMIGSSTIGGLPTIYIQVSPTTSKIEIYALGSGAMVGATTLSTSAWYHLALVGNTGTSQATTCYLNGVSEATGTGGTGTYSNGRIEYGNSTSAESVTGQLAIGKIWNAKLTQSEVQQEMRCQRPQRTANLWQWCPMLSASDLKDYSGNLRDLTGTTLTDGQGPPVAWSAFLPSVYVPAAASAGIVSRRTLDPRAGARGVPWI